MGELVGEQVKEVVEELVEEVVEGGEWDMAGKHEETAGRNQETIGGYPRWEQAEVVVVEEVEEEAQG